MKKYQIIYADPPWDSRKSGWGGYKHYPTMKIDEICNLPVHKIIDNDCVLFLWTLGCHLDSALRVIGSWGFIYKTIAFNWVKTYKDGALVSGLGHWVKQGSEICLLGTHGNPKRVNKDVLQVIIAQKTKHSEKPSEIRKRIVELMGDLPRIELFARKPQLLFEDESFKGWDVWGNEVESDIEL